MSSAKLVFFSLGLELAGTVSAQTYVLKSTRLFDSTTGAQPGRTNEETWILLPDNTIVTVQCFPPYHGVKYVVSSGTWQDEGTLPVTIVDPVMSEVGPGMLLYNGKVIFTGAANSRGHGKTVLYTPPVSPNAPGPSRSGSS